MSALLLQPMDYIALFRLTAAPLLLMVTDCISLIVLKLELSLMTTAYIRLILVLLIISAATSASGRRCRVRFFMSNKQVIPQILSLNQAQRVMRLIGLRIVRIVGVLVLEVMFQIIILFVIEVGRLIGLLLTLPATSASVRQTLAL